MTRPRLPALSPAPVLALLLAACAAEADGPDRPTATVRDSAGIVVVENPSTAADMPLPWSLGDDPLLTIGTLDGPESHQLYRVRSARLLPDGRVVVANDGSGELRLFGPDGSYLESWGRAGEGPGEFRQTASLFLWPGGDSLGVWDGRIRRLSLFGLDGTLGRTLTFPEVAGIRSPSVTDVLPDGGVVLNGTRFEFDGSDGITRPPIHAMVVEADGTLRGALGGHPGSEAVIQASAQAVNIVGVPFARTSVVEAVGNRIVFTPNDRWELHVYAADGRLERLVRLARAARPVTDSHRNAFIEARVAQAPEEARAGLRTALTEGPAPDSMPAFQRVVGDARGNAWVQEYRPDFEEGPTHWLVFDPEGRLLGRVETPEGLTVFQIGEDFLVGRSTDELGVEQVQLWALER